MTAATEVLGACLTVLMRCLLRYFSFSFSTESLFARATAYGARMQWRRQLGRKLPRLRRCWPPAASRAGTAKGNVSSKQNREGAAARRRRPVRLKLSYRIPLPLQALLLKSGCAKHLPNLREMVCGPCRGQGCAIAQLTRDAHAQEGSCGGVVPRPRLEGWSFLKSRLVTPARKEGTVIRRPLFAAVERGSPL